MTLAKKIEECGASIINTGIGWHEARIPTIATMVPRGGFSWVTKRLKGEVNIPLCTTNRINMPEVAEDILASGHSDMVSMARPFLADPYFVRKAKEGQSHMINTCIGCNQACLDHVFVGKRASCLVNPMAGYETSLKLAPISPDKKQKIAVVGAGPAGLAFAVSAAERGHDIEIFEKSSKIGGQFNLAKIIPGKEEFYETLRYYKNQLQAYNVKVNLNKEVNADDLLSKGYQSIVLATGVTPRDINLPNTSTKVNVMSYYDLLTKNEEKVKVGKSIAIVGAGGIGFDVADYLMHMADQKEVDESIEVPLDKKVDKESVEAFLQDWNIDSSSAQLASHDLNKNQHFNQRKIYLLQRKKGKLGKTLGKTTGWIHRTNIKKKGVTELSGCQYLGVSDEGFKIKTGDQEQILPVDTVVICAGQEPLRELLLPLSGNVVLDGHKFSYASFTYKYFYTENERDNKPNIFMIGGALEAGELDAKRAIDQGTRLAAVIENAKTGDVFNQPTTKGMVMDTLDAMLNMKKKVFG